MSRFRKVGYIAGLDSRVVLASLAAATLLLGTACSSSGTGKTKVGDQPSAATASKSGSSLSSLVPKEVRDRGYISVGTDPQFGPPTNYHPNNNDSEWAGIEPDLLREIAKRLGVSVKWQQTSWVNEIPGLISGRYDVAANGMQDSIDRQKQIDMLDYSYAYESLFVRKGNPQKIASLEDTCGKTVGVTAASVQLEYIKDFSKENCPAGNSIKTLTFQNRAASILAVEGGQADAADASLGITINLAHNLDGQNEKISTRIESLASTISFQPSYTGFGFQKGSSLINAFQAALTEIMSDGTYKTLMEKWYYPDKAMMSAPAINGAKNGTPSLS